ncbi:MAG: carbohydrate ABC transporter permease [Ruminococcaceae bacterium]|nr:carbohydrate ABC transporter permease [Oscillospiraceae bacterium]
MDSNTVIRKETKNRIRVDYEGKLSFKERMKKKLKASNTWIKALVNVCRFILMMGVSYVILYPFVAKIAGSFMTIDDVVSPTVALIPSSPTLNLYKTIALENHYVEAFFNTLLLSLVCALLQTLVSCLIGYGLAKFKFKGNKAVMITVVLTMIIPHVALGSAMTNYFVKFDLFRVFAWNYKGPIEAIFGHTIHLDQTFWPLIMLSATGLAFKNGLYIYLMRQFFRGVPDELEESAYVDGANTFRTFFQIIIPLSVPMMITIFLFSFSWQWSDEFYTRICFPTGQNADNMTYLMPDVLQVPTPLEKKYSAHEGWTLYKPYITNTAGMMAISPLIILYLFCQRYLVQGIERSGLVG